MKVCRSSSSIKTKNPPQIPTTFIMFKAPCPFNSLPQSWKIRWHIFKITSVESVNANYSPWARRANTSHTSVTLASNTLFAFMPEHFIINIIMIPFPSIQHDLLKFFFPLLALSISFPFHIASLPSFYAHSSPVGIYYFWKKNTQRHTTPRAKCGVRKGITVDTCVLGSFGFLLFRHCRT